MTTEINISSKKFAAIVHSFIKNEPKHTNGCEKRIANMLITKDDNVIVVKNNTMKTVLIVEQPNQEDINCAMRFVNATTVNRLAAIIDILGWHDIQVESKKGIIYLLTQNGKMEKLNSSKLYSKEELVAIAEGES